jgi:undecaprenyl-diphosphatase
VPALVRRFDARAETCADRLRGPLADRLFYGASALGDFGLLWVLLAFARWVRGTPRDRRAARRALAGIALESVLVNLVLKSLFGRRRPVREDPHPLPLRQPLTSSFPSGHATAAFCAATLLGDGDAAAPAYFAAAAVVAASRVYVRIHHASDVVGGTLVGLALGTVVRRVFPLDGVRRPKG